MAEKIQRRTNAKNNGNYDLADKIRNELLDEGILIEDQKEKLFEIQMIKDKIYIFDTTLRDGAQTEGVDFSMKIRIK